MRLLLLPLVALLPAVCFADVEVGGGEWVHEVSGGGVVLIGYTGAGGKVEVPRSIDGVPVVAVGDGWGPVFGGRNNSVGEVVVPPGVQRISAYAFHGCEGLGRVSLPEGLSVIGNSAFAACLKLSAIEIPQGVSVIGDHAFSGCPRLAKVSFPASLRVVGAYAFADCVRLEQAVLPEGTEVVGERAFSGCRGLKNVVLPNTLVSAGNWSFSGTAALENLSLPARFTAQIGVMGFTGELASRLMAQGVAGILDSLAAQNQPAPEATAAPAPVEGELPADQGNNFR